MHDSDFIRQVEKIRQAAWDTEGDRLSLNDFAALCDLLIEDRSPLRAAGYPGKDAAA